MIISRKQYERDIERAKYERDREALLERRFDDLVERLYILETRVGDLRAKVDNLTVINGHVCMKSATRVNENEQTD